MYQTISLCESVLHKHSADVMRSDAPWGSKSPHLQVGVLKSLQIRCIRRGKQLVLSVVCSLLSGAGTLTISGTVLNVPRSPCTHFLPYPIVYWTSLYLNSTGNLNSFLHFLIWLPHFLSTPLSWVFLWCCNFCSACFLQTRCSVLSFKNRALSWPLFAEINTRGHISDTLGCVFVYMMTGKSIIFDSILIGATKVGTNLITHLSISGSIGSNHVKSTRFWQHGYLWIACNRPSVSYLAESKNFLANQGWLNKINCFSLSCFRSSFNNWGFLIYIFF